MSAPLEGPEPSLTHFKIPLFILDEILDGTGSIETTRDWDWSIIGVPDNHRESGFKLDLGISCSRSGPIVGLLRR